jgi:hypothetical protein
MRIRIGWITHTEKPMLAEHAARFIEILDRMQHRHTELVVIELHRTLHVTANEGHVVEAFEVKYWICAHLSSVVSSRPTR